MTDIDSPIRRLWRRLFASWIDDEIDRYAIVEEMRRLEHVETRFLPELTFDEATPATQASTLVDWYIR